MPATVFHVWRRRLKIQPAWIFNLDSSTLLFTRARAVGR
jgi:hypothetical protein